MKTLLARCVVILTLVAMLLAGVVPAFASVNQQAQFAIPVLIANTSFLNVRTGPAADYGVLVTVVGGTEMPVLGIASDRVWYFVATAAGNGWVNVEYTIPRGDFRHVPQIDLKSVPPPTSFVVPVTIGIPIVHTQGGIDRDYGVERYRAALNVESANLRETPTLEGTVLRILFMDDSTDYAIVGRTTDRRNIEWLALDVPGVGIGWIETPKLTVRLSGRYRDVLTVVGDVVGVLERPMGQFLNVPPLVHGDEVFLLDISPDGQLIKVELPNGAVGWIPFSSVVGRENTSTDDLYVPNQPPYNFDPGQGGGSAPGFVVVPVQPPVTTAPAAPLTAIVNTGNLNIRTGPGAQFATVITVPGGTHLPVLAMASDEVWYLVGGPFGQGWLNKEFVIFRGTFNNLPVIPWATAAAQASVGPVMAVVSVPMQLYAAPGTHQPVVGLISGPAEYQIVARNNNFNWVQLLTPAGFGWVPAAQVIVRGDASWLPVI